MDKYRRYYGIGVFVLAILLSIYGSYSVIKPKTDKLSTLSSSIERKTAELERKKKDKVVVMNKLKKIKDSLATSQKRIYSPIESDLGNDSLFFTLYTDVMDIVRSNSVKIKKAKYEYNPQEDSFVKSGGGDYFVCDINLDLVSNYTNLGKLLQEIYQYPYYIKVNQLDVKPYAKDKKILLVNLSLRLYSHTEPINE